MDMERCNSYGKMAETLKCWLEAELAKGMSSVNTKEAGEVTDMIKDLEEACSKHYEACYYKLVAMAMMDHNNPENESMGYNHRHMANGQFASSGRGHVVGFHHNKPYVDQGPYIDAYLHDPDFERNMSMGYEDTIRGNYGGRQDSRSSSRYGRAYDDYQNAKRGYTESRSMKDKERMNSSAMEHVRDVETVLREMWKDGDPMLKREMKESLSNVLGDMTV